MTGFALSFARAIGEDGSVIFISSNLQYKTGIAPLLIYSLLEEYEYPAAMGVAIVLIVISFIHMAHALNYRKRFSCALQWVFAYRKKIAKHAREMKPAMPKPGALNSM